MLRILLESARNVKSNENKLPDKYDIVVDAEI